MENKIKQIALHYGDKQIEKTIEELGELIVALSKFSQKICQENQANVIEEIADVEIMTAQLKYLFCWDMKVDAIKNQKLNRQLERMAGEGK